ncbi:MAG: HNH endonuclease [Leptospirales bacterium]
MNIENRYDLWPEIEKWYREISHGTHQRLSFIPMRYVRQWLTENGLDGSMPGSEASKYQPVWSTLRQEFLNGKERKCTICGIDVAGKRETDEVVWDRTEVDHIVPIHSGGLEFDMSNLRIVCHKCNMLNMPVHLRHGRQTRLWENRPQVRRI